MKILAFILFILSFCLQSCFYQGDLDSSELPSNATYVQNDHYKAYTSLEYDQEDFSEYSYFKKDSLNSSGDVRILVVPVYFAHTDDSTFAAFGKTKDAVRDDINTAFFGTSEETGWESVKSYYEKVSYNKVNISGEVTDWYYTENSYQYYGKYSYTINELIDDITESLDKNIKKKYDTDSDGWIDELCLIYSQMDFQQMNDDNLQNLWALTSWTEENPNKKSPVTNTYLWASFDFMYKSENIKVDAHTYIHEIGHGFGLDDYYDYNVVKNGNYAGGWTMQDNNVGSLDPYSRMTLGWFNNIYVIEETCEINLKPLEDSGDIVLISENFWGSPFDEYYLIDYYTPTGLNEFDTKYPYDNSIYGVNSEGLRIWHVDSRILNVYTTLNEALYNLNGYGSAYSVDSFFRNNAGAVLANTNTTYSADYASYCSYLISFRNFRLLELIRGNGEYKSSENFCEDDLFKNGEYYLWEFNDSENTTEATLEFTVDDAEHIATINVEF